MDEQRLFRLAVEAGAVTFQHVPGEGWRCVLWTRRGDEEWSDSERDFYSHLTTRELLDTIGAVLDARL